MNTALKIISLVLLSLSTDIPLQAQKEFKFVDMHVCSSQKAFESQFDYANRELAPQRRFQFLEKMENDCLSGLIIPPELRAAYDGIPKSSQAHIMSMFKGNIRISNQVLKPTEHQFLAENQYLVATSDPSIIYKCLAGVEFEKERFSQSQVDYFWLVLKQLQYIDEELSYDYHIKGKKYKCRIVRNTDDLRQIMASENEMGWVMSIGGGHSLGNYTYIATNQMKSTEYENVIIHNIDRLKGAAPLHLKTEEYLDIPILSINFGNVFEDGICGKVVHFSLSEENAFGSQGSMGKSVTTLGQTAIKRLLDKEKGRRVLIDIGGMSLKSREWYYKYIKERRFYKDTIPIIASNVGISGLSKRNSAYTSTDEKIKSQSSYLNHRHANLCDQDIKAIIKSKGLIGLSLDRDKLMGRSSQAKYDSYMAGTANQREIAINSIIANLCTIIHKSNTVEAWKHISISTEFDTHTRHFNQYESAKDMYRLSNDLLEFFKNPRDTDLYTKKEIENYMGGYTPEQIVDMITHENALRFMYEHLPQVQLKP